MTANMFPALLSFLLLAATAGPAAAEFLPLRAHTIDHDGLSRKYLVYTPKGAADHEGPRPLVLVIHGGGGTHWGMPGLTKKRFHELADRDGFYVVYPNAVDKMWDFAEGFISENLKTRIDDLGFFRKLLERLEKDYPIDSRRIFATGISRGGQASYFLACRLPGVFRAIAPVTMPLPGYLEDDCEEGPPVGVAILNGTADKLVPYEGGQITVLGQDRGRTLSTDETIRLWRQRNGCSEKVESRVLPDRDKGNTRVERFDWADCSGAPIRLFRIENGGHTWPSGGQYLPAALVGEVTQDIDGATEIWDFFSAFE